jgi:hypothetical protein
MEKRGKFSTQFTAESVQMAIQRGEPKMFMSPQLLLIFSGLPSTPFGPVKPRLPTQGHTASGR